MCLKIWKLHDILTNIDKLVFMPTKKNINIILINKNTKKKLKTNVDHATSTFPKKNCKILCVSSNWKNKWQFFKRFILKNEK